MSKTIVVLESKSKVDKVQKFLGSNYIVTACLGHIRDLPHSKLSIDIENRFTPNYEITESKKHVVKKLKELYKTNGKDCKVLLACDYDREGESISWHVAELLKLKSTNRRRLLFTEITKTAILDSIKNSKEIDMNMVYAQQARRILDRLIGYIITPILWKHIQSSYKKNNALSAGRVQSVVLKLIIERENEIKKHTSTSSYKVDGNFIYPTLSSKFLAHLNKDLPNKDKTIEILYLCNKSKFSIFDIKVKKTNRSPQAPFITSSLQQEASNKFKMSPKLTMRTAQVLYENGYITYMRTDSLVLSDEAKENIKKFIIDNFGSDYYNNKDYKNKGSNCQEAHEAIRPCKFTITDVVKDSKMTQNEIKLYKLIWERTIASQMSSAKVEIITNIIKGDKLPEDIYFTYKNEKILFEGFLKVRNTESEIEIEKQDQLETSNINKNSKIKFKKRGELDFKTFNGVEKFSKPSHLRYTEASLIKKLDDLGIGRPSTYASMVSIVQDRNYVNKKDLEGITKDAIILEIVKNKRIEEKISKIKLCAEKQKLVPTDIGEIVNSFMIQHFSSIIDYSYTLKIEDELDKISNGQLKWYTFLKTIYDDLYTTSDILMKEKQLEKSKHKRILGKYPNTNDDIVCYIGKYGPLVQHKIKFAPLGDIKLEEVTLSQAIELLKYPKTLGKYKENDVIIKKGKFGVYFTCNKKNYSIPLETQNDNFKLKNAIDIIKAQISKTKSNIINQFGENIIIKTGPYGPYINYNKKQNIKIFNRNPNDLTEDDCLEIIAKQKKYKNTKRS
jgi:DNA topoisomerase I